mmetsp:Transcript_15516/g.33111  ORF Transcript_15516/g.33111 Transcript_15516/m.33111 type:complete len:231 (-) Transcript_15516:1503-2195(-)
MTPSLPVLKREKRPRRPDSFSQQVERVKLSGACCFRGRLGHLCPYAGAALCASEQCVSGDAARACPARLPIGVGARVETSMRTEIKMEKQHEDTPGVASDASYAPFLPFFFFPALLLDFFLSPPPPPPPDRPPPRAACRSSRTSSSSSSSSSSQSCCWPPRLPAPALASCCAPCSSCAVSSPAALISARSRPPHSSASSATSCTARAANSHAPFSFLSDSHEPASSTMSR